MKNVLSLLSMLFILLLSFFACKTGEKDDVLQPPPSQCEITNARAKGDRLIGLDLLNLTETNGFDENIGLALELGIDYIALHLPWSSIESSPGTYTDPFNALQLLGQAATDNNMKFSLTLRPIDLTGKTVPSDLENIRFNDTQMSTRFNELVDYVFTRVDPTVLLNIQIGNEIDGYDTSNEHPDFWSDYGAFLFNTQQYIHSLQPGIAVGFTATYDGLMEQPDLFKALTAAVDVLGVTYYPLKGNFDVEAPDVIFTDLDNLVNTFPAIDIYLQEVGYQTSTENNSSEEQQATFFCNFFQAWDTHSDRIKTANIVRLNDLSVDEAQASAGPYGINATPFIEYLRTLGLRTFAAKGEEKKAFGVIKDNLSARSW